MPRTLLIGWKRWVGFAALLVVILSAVDYVFGVNSDAMSVARETLRASSVLQRRVGPVRSVDLDWLWGFTERSRFDGSTATVHVSITGTTGKEHIVMDLREIDGQWHVIHSSAPI